jgi:hypothetical protein
VENIMIIYMLIFFQPLSLSQLPACQIIFFVLFARQNPFV